MSTLIGMNEVGAHTLPRYCSTPKLYPEQILTLFYICSSYSPSNDLVNPRVDQMVAWSKRLQDLCIGLFISDIANNSLEVGVVDFLGSRVDLLLG